MNGELSLRTQIALLLAILPLASTSVAKYSSYISVPTFSSTQNIAVPYRHIQQNLGRTDPRIDLPPPPKSQSLELRTELEILIKLERIRTTQLSELITYEASAGPWLGPFSIEDHLQAGTPVSNVVDSLLEFSMNEVFIQKLRFDRARPSFLETKLKPLISNPGHPAYPSGHACQYYLVARALSEIAPKNKSDILCDAIHVAVRREVAGVHYPSDSAAGVTLAGLIYDEWKQSKSNLALLEKARAWWSTNAHSFTSNGRHRWNKRYANQRLNGTEVCTLDSVRNSYLHASHAKRR
jgi:hypothetical protein